MKLIIDFMKEWTSIPLSKQKALSKKNWFFVEIKRDGLTKTHGTEYIDSVRREKIHNWCIANCKKHWSEERILEYSFEDEEDSVLFALTWC